MTTQVYGKTSRALPDPLEEPTVTAERWAAVVGVSPRSVLYAVNRGEIPAVRIGRRVVILTARALAQAGLLTPTNSEAVPGTGTAAASIQRDATTDDNATNLGQSSRASRPAAVRGAR